MSDTTTITPEERHYYVREKQFQITSEDVRSWLMEATRDRRKTTYELNGRIYRLVTALKSVHERAAELEAERDRLRAVVAELRKELRSVYADGNDRVDELSKESARLRAELETARYVAASAQSVAEAAWGGEIPSPLPGHKHMTEDDLAAMDAHLDCPLCGGSGHIGDCDATAASEVKRLRAERDWLAENVADRPCAYDSCPFGLHRPTGPDDDDCDKTRAQCWQEAARRAVGGEG